MSWASSGTDRLELRDQRGEKFGRERAVDDPVIDRDRNPGAAASDDFAVDHHPPRLDGAEGDHAAFRWIDDRSAGLHWPARADVRDRNGAAAHLAGWERSGAGALDQLGALFRDRCELELVRASE